MPPFATTDGICGVEPKAKSRNTRLIHNSRNHPKVPETRRCAGCRLWSSMSGVGQKRRFDRLPFTSGLPHQRTLSGSVDMSQTCQ